ncbi:34041_t:CDS:2 [Gigaspora margarita]|uniref:34041_t:CDS:1 n=1 Tax=Gigaspora margarita TaxID=4874 RepID=A0ABN7US42_GIGMA|nr:34041_t:CDS:2 [Gigaspora margarita]
MKTITTIRDRDFMITIIQDNFEPGFLCHSEDLRSKLCKSSSEAITSFTNNEAIVKIYQNFQKVYIFGDASPNTVWNKVGILAQFTGNTLFGLEHEHTKSAIEKEQTTHGTVDDWQTLLRHTGCSNITPFRKESKDDTTQDFESPPIEVEPPKVDINDQDT